MNQNKTIKDLPSEIKKDTKKSKFDVLTNERDFLVKNLKKAGWFIRAKNSFLELNNDFLNDYPKIFLIYQI